MVILRWLALGPSLLALVSATPAAAKVYPTNLCVAAKQKEAGLYCQRALKAWAGSEKGGSAADRDAALAEASAKLAAAWDKAEAKAQAKGVDCQDTTLAVAAAQADVGSAVGAIVDGLNGGLSLANKDHALGAAAIRCAALLKAESILIKALAKDPKRATRDAAQTKARGKFAATWGKAVQPATCPTTATQGSIESLVDGLVGDLVRDTEVSPNVDATQYTTISPAGTTPYQGKDITPVCMDGSPYHFFVKRGTVNKLVVYYQGGGACWEQLTCSVPVCDANVNPAGGDNPNNSQPRPGFADLTNPGNPFKDWNAVFISYCSCDIHFGDAAQDYGNTNPAQPKHVEHRGFHNARIVEKWAREHFVNPDVVFVTGSSAGAYGAWFHAPLLEERVWPASRFHVLADAGNGVITPEFLTDSFPHWNFVANLPTNIPGLQDVITGGGGIPAYTELVAQRYPDTTWAHYATAFDGGTGGQTGFYNVMLHNNNPIAALTWWEGSCAFNAKMREQVSSTAADLQANDNYRYYIGTGSRHTMWGSNKVYTDTTGGVPQLVDWVNAMLASGNGAADPAWGNVECTTCGLLLPNDVRPSPLVPPFTQVGADVVIQCSPGGAFVD